MESNLEHKKINGEIYYYLTNLNQNFYESDPFWSRYYTSPWYKRTELIYLSKREDLINKYFYKDIANIIISYSEETNPNNLSNLEIDARKDVKRQEFLKWLFS